MATRNAQLDQRIEKLEAIEKVKPLLCVPDSLATCFSHQDIGKLMNLAASAVSELCKASPSSETVEYTTKDFVKTLDVSCDSTVTPNSLPTPPLSLSHSLIPC